MERLQRAEFHGRGPLHRIQVEFHEFLRRTRRDDMAVGIEYDEAGFDVGEVRIGEIREANAGVEDRNVGGEEGTDGHVGTRLTLLGVLKLCTWQCETRLVLASGDPYTVSHRPKTC